MAHLTYKSIKGDLTMGQITFVFWVEMNLFFAAYHIFKHFAVSECNNTCIIQEIGITFEPHFTNYSNQIN